MSKYDEAITKLREIAIDNDSVCEAIEKNQYDKIIGSEERKKHLLATYRYWSKCCHITAWLLENAELG